MTFTAGIGHRNKQTFRQAPRYERVTYLLWFRSKRGEYLSYTFNDQLVSGKILLLSTVFSQLNFAFRRQIKSLTYIQSHGAQIFLNFQNRKNSLIPLMAILQIKFENNSFTSISLANLKRWLSILICAHQSCPVEEYLPLQNQPPLKVAQVTPWHHQKVKRYFLPQDFQSTGGTWALDDFAIFGIGNTEFRY